MTEDAQTYKRAVTAALLGLGTQVVLLLLIAILGLYAKSAAIQSATWYVGGGVLIWLALSVLFYKHYQERQEALEAEQLASADARTAAMFDEAGQQLAVARRGLELTLKYGLPLVGLLLAAYLLTLGGVLLNAAANASEENRLVARAISAGANFRLLTLLMGVAGFIAFLMARYLAGMTQLKAWQPLRAGAAYLMGNALVAVLLLVASVLAILDNLNGFAVAAFAIPVFMIGLGAEIVLSLLLNIYVPRRPGEYIRAAFDSRILGWLTRPESIGKIITETLNYQFGFEVSRSWFFRLLSRWTPWLVVASAVLLLGMSVFVVVGPEQQAVVTSWGKLDRVVDPGLHFKPPWPWGGARKYDVYRVHQLVLGTRLENRKEDVPLLWTNEHTEGGQETFLVVAPTQLEVEDRQLQSDAAAGELIGADIIIDYRIDDLEQYVNSAADPVAMLTALADMRINAFFATQQIDALLSGGRVTAAEQLQSLIGSAIRDAKLGLVVTAVSISAVHPPQTGEVATSFHEQVGALQEKQTTIEEARREAIRMLSSAAGSPARADQIKAAIEQWQTQNSRLEAAGGADEQLAARVAEHAAQIEQMIDAAGGEAARTILLARAERWRQAIGELGESQSFAAQLLAYRRAPEYYRMRLAMQTFADAVKDKRKIVIESDQDQPTVIEFDFKQVTSELGMLSGEQ